MNSIASKYRFCQQVVKYSLKYGATKASVRYKVCRKVIYDWRKKYDGTWKKASCRVLVALTTTQGSIPRKNMSSSGVTILTTKTTRYVCGISCGKKGYTRCYKVCSRNQAHESESIARQAQGIPGPNRMPKRNIRDRRCRST